MDVSIHLVQSGEQYFYDLMTRLREIANGVHNAPLHETKGWFARSPVEIPTGGFTAAEKQAIGNRLTVALSWKKKRQKRSASG